MSPKEKSQKKRKEGDKGQKGPSLAITVKERI